MAACAPRFAKPLAIRQIPDDPTHLFLECQVQSTPKPDVTWFHNDTKLSNTSTKHKQTIKTVVRNSYNIALEISNLTAIDAGTYKIIVKNKTGEISESVNLNFSTDDGTKSKINDRK